MSEKDDNGDARLKNVCTKVGLTHCRHHEKGSSKTKAKWIGELRAHIVVCEATIHSQLRCRPETKGIGC